MANPIQTPPPLPTPLFSPYPGEDCRTNGAWWYCAMPDPNTSRHFDTRDCYSSGDRTYCSINTPYIYNDNSTIGGFPAIYVIGAVILALCVLAVIFRKRPPKPTAKR